MHNVEQRASGRYSRTVDRYRLGSDPRKARIAIKKKREDKLTIGHRTILRNFAHINLRSSNPNRMEISTMNLLAQGRARGEEYKKTCPIGSESWREMRGHRELGPPGNTVTSTRHQ